MDIQLFHEDKDVQCIHAYGIYGHSTFFPLCIDIVYFCVKAVTNACYMYIEDSHFHIYPQCISPVSNIKIKKVEYVEKIFFAVMT